MTGADGIFSAQDYWSVGADREVAHWQTKWQIEQHIRRLELPATILRPAAFMENYYIPAVEKSLLKGRLADPIKPDVPYQTIASDDIGKFVALAFAQPHDFIGRELEIAGSSLTNRQAVEVFSRILGRPVKYRRLPMPIVRVVLGREYYQMFRWFNRGGFEADIAALRRDYPDVPLRSVEEWLREEGWEGRRRIAVARDKMGRPLALA
jgi:uncharacterized protein YbjT (DUF2867 family)